MKIIPFFIILLNLSLSTTSNATIVSAKYIKKIVCTSSKSINDSCGGSVTNIFTLNFKEITADQNRPDLLNTKGRFELKRIITGCTGSVTKHPGLFQGIISAIQNYGGAIDLNVNLFKNVNENGREISQETKEFGRFLIFRSNFNAAHWGPESGIPNEYTCSGSID